MMIVNRVCKVKLLEIVVTVIIAISNNNSNNFIIT